jgi:MFS family permease
MERSILPAIAEQDFALAARTAVLSFIVVFGVTKAISNYFAGRLADSFGRKHVLVAGWLVAAPVPFLLMWAPSWSWILAANALLGISQGLTWSATVIMKVDLVGARNRGLAMGLKRIRRLCRRSWRRARDGIHRRPERPAPGAVLSGRRIRRTRTRPLRARRP